MKKNSMFIKMAVAFVVLLVLIVYIVGNIFSNGQEKLAQEKAKYVECLGDEYIIDKDTLTIVDYSMWTETFTLSNGKKVNQSLIIKE